MVFQEYSTAEVVARKALDICIQKIEQILSTNAYMYMCTFLGCLIVVWFLLNRLPCDYVQAQEANRTQEINKDVEIFLARNCMFVL